MYRETLKVGPVILSALALFIAGVFPAVSFAQTGSSFQWTVTERPPELVNPKQVDMSKQGASNLGAFNIHCGGKVYNVYLGDNEDAIVSMSGTEPLQYPLRIMGGRNVRIVGLRVELVTQPGCGIGELPNRPVDQYPNANIHPRIPGGMAMRLQQSGTTFVEGVYLDMRGHEADCFVARNPDWMSGAQAREQRHLIFQNSTCLGNEGQGDIEGLGDGVHGDLFHNQVEAVGRLVFENFTHRQSQNGVILQKKQGYLGAKEFILRRFDYSWDPRYVGDDDYERFGLASHGYADKWSFEDVYIDDWREGGDYVFINDQRYGNGGSQVQPHPGIHSGLPPQTAFALPEHTGTNYISPHSQSGAAPPQPSPNPPGNLAAN